jgi:hypothetical protein
MRVLVDTHAILWWLVDDKRLSKTARQILEDSTHVRLVSFASLWEIAIKMGAGRLLVKGLHSLSSHPCSAILNSNFCQSVLAIWNVWTLFRGIIAIHSIGS